MPKSYNQPECEWSYLVHLDDIVHGAKTIKFAADENQCLDLARRLGVVSVEGAKATITLQKVGGGIVHAIGTVEAQVTQNCVVSLVPIAVAIQDEFEGWFGDKTSTAVSFAKAKSDREAKKGHVEVEVLEESEDPEPIVNGKMDIGELATQYLCLAIDPYPHAPGVSAEFVATPQGKAGERAEIRKNPFEALKDWKEKR